MPKKYQNNTNFEKYGKFLFKVYGVLRLPEVSKLLHQIQLFDGFYLMCLYIPTQKKN